MELVKKAMGSGKKALGAAKFFARFCSSPREVGALIPSSPALAKKMSELAEGFDLALELGSGCGAITKEISKREHKEIWAVELDKELAERLQEDFPKAKVIQGCAADAVDAARESWVGSAAVVSSLPFRSLPKAIGDRAARSIEKFLLEEKERRLVQFTYASGEPFDLENPELEWRREGVVWLNTPPAFVWVLERRP